MSESELNIRPQYLDEYVGQKEFIKNLRIYIDAAKKRCETLDHVLLYGPPGLGKTTLAQVIANEMGSKFRVVTATNFEKVGDIISVLSELEPGDVLFIDEIHRIPKNLEETFYSAMEDFKCDILITKDYNAKTLTLNLPPFTLIGATTKAGELSSPLRNRFGITYRLVDYTVDELKTVILRTSKCLNFLIDNDASYEIAKRSRGIPRIANNLFKRIRDFAIFYDTVKINKELVKKVFSDIGIDEKGLDNIDKLYLKTMILRYNGGPVGLETLANSIGESSTNLEDVYEPYLIKIGFIEKTIKGRIATKKAYEHLKIKCMR